MNQKERVPFLTIKEIYDTEASFQTNHKTITINLIQTGNVRYIFSYLPYCRNRLGEKPDIQLKLVKLSKDLRFQRIFPTPLSY